MSHISKIQVIIKDLDALKAACRRLGFEFREGSARYAWWGTRVGNAPLPKGIRVEDLGKCQHEITVPGADYSVGVVQQGDHYTLLWDSWYTGGLVPVLGQNAERLVQAYGVEAALAEVRAQGFSCWEEAQEDGSIKLHVQTGG